MTNFFLSISMEKIIFFCDRGLLPSRNQAQGLSKRTGASVEEDNSGNFSGFGQDIQPGLWWPFRPLWSFWSAVQPSGREDSPVQNLRVEASQHWKGLFKRNFTCKRASRNLDYHYSSLILTGIPWTDRLLPSQSPVARVMSLTLETRPLLGTLFQHCSCYRSSLTWTRGISTLSDRWSPKLCSNRRPEAQSSRPPRLQPCPQMTSRTGARSWSASSSSLMSGGVPSLPSWNAWGPWPERSSAKAWLISRIWRP